MSSHGDLDCKFCKTLILEFSRTIFVFKVENCIFECVDLGKLVKVRIEHDNKNPGAGWFLDQVSVQPIGSGKATVSEIDDVVIFPCYRFVNSFTWHLDGVFWT